MSSPDVDRILSLVKEKTGYPVSVSLDSTMTLHSMMNAATEASPVHVILLNPKYDRMSNYLVATQCAMILLKWADPKRITNFGFTADHLQRLASKLCPERPFSKELLTYLIQPLLHQLVSEPGQIMSAEWLWKEFPGLRDEQRLHMTADLRGASACLSPQVKEVTPKAVFEKSAIMGSAYALWWSQIEGSQVALLPYKAMGYLKKGQELLDALNAIPANDKERWMKVVDAWAHKLELNGYYLWKFGTAT